MAMHTSRPQRLGDVLQAVIGDMGIREKMDEARMVESWAIIAGPRIDAVTDKAWVKRGHLFVRITSAVWRHELHLRRNEWRERLNEHLGADLVKEIVFR